MRLLRYLPISLLFALTSGSDQQPYQPFLSALTLLPPALLSPSENDTTNPSNTLASSPAQTTPDLLHDVLKRQYSNTCPTSFSACSNLNAPQLCCYKTAACTTDNAGDIACCPSGYACTGSIGGVITAGTYNPNGGGTVGDVSTTGGTTTTGGAGIVTVTSTGSSYVYGSSTAGVAGATTTTTSEVSGLSPIDGSSTTASGFVVDGSSTVATPGAARRGAQVPFVARMIVEVAQLLRI